MQIQITRVLETTDFGDKGQSVPSVRVEFKVGEHGPFSINLPKSQFTAIAANAKIQEYAQHVMGLQGVK